ncbi:hypothetical protein [Candidatus Protofrankia californiensis]|uniref:hypothetical protein n=1 Tax=Candidatus Protofrankia californiensis TaxID=1839754 RepID=UPI001041A846|nr:hypothetical protein [Candidatus Protofrankia californiensis]
MAVPSWARGNGSRLAAHERLLLSCRPGGPEALLAAAVPATFLSSRASERTREGIARFWRPVLVMYFTGWGATNPQLEWAVPFYEPRAGSTRPVVLFRVPTRAEAAESEQDLESLLVGDPGPHRFGYVLSSEPSAAEGLGFERHHPATAKLKQDVADFGEIATIGDLFDLPDPSIIVQQAKGKGELCTAQQPGAVRVVRGADLHRDGTIRVADGQATYAVVATEKQLKAGDILLRAHGWSTDSQIPVVEVTEADLPLASSGTVIVLRPKGGLGLDEQDLAAAAYYLRSPTARRLINAERSNRLSLARSELQRVRVPKADESLNAALADLNDAVREFDHWRMEAQDALENAFTEESVRAMRAHLVNKGRLLRLRHEAAALIDDSSFVVRTRYPYPVAFRWRRAEAALSADHAADAFDEVLGAVEVLLCFLALVSLALAYERGIGLEARKIFTEGLRKKGGPTFGTWRLVLEKIGESPDIGALPDSHPLRDLWRAVADPGFQDRARYLLDLRNADAHLIGPDSTELPHVVDRAVQSLQDLLNSVSFLADLTLAEVTRTGWDSLTKTGEVTYRELVGDHPVVRTRRIPYPSPEVERGSLYLLDGEQRLYLLRPYLTGRICAACRTWATFHVGDAKGSPVTLKSMGCVHTAEDTTLRDTLKRVGLLPADK